MAAWQRNGGWIAQVLIRALTCGVLVTDGSRLLIGHATRSVRWDIPKGGADPGESAEAAVRRELYEETGLTAPSQIEFLGQVGYMPRKDLALFVWAVTTMPDAATLVCRSTFLASGRPLPEFDRFACLPWSEALPKLGKSMATVLRPIVACKGWHDALPD